MVIQYKCPDCGANMVFDSTTGKLHCNSCNHEEAIENYQESFESFRSRFHDATFGDEEARQYYCKNCGAVLVTDNHTAATVCSFCGSPMILGERISGDFAPAQIIPFRISKEEAQKAFKKWCQKLRFTPRDFSKGERIRKVTGMYVPFWLYDLRGQGEAHLACTRTRTYDDDEYVVTETSHFDVYRQIDVTLRGIPADASIKMADDLMDRLEPFDYSEMKTFEIPYLSGFLSEKYNFTDKELLPRVSKRCNSYLDDYVQTTVKGYQTKNIVERDYHVDALTSSYTLLPVWMVYYDYDNAEYAFAMNGQTGKIAGNPPVDYFKAIGYGGIFSFAVFLLLRLITMILGGPLL